jgi:uncharacterized protein YjbI with pentapeptide repeats
VRRRGTQERYEVEGEWRNGYYLPHAFLDGIDLRGAHLADADLPFARLRGAILVDADLTDAYLSSADLTGADLNGAILRRTDCHSITFRQANLTRRKGTEFRKGHARGNPGRRRGRGPDCSRDW